MKGFFVLQKLKKRHFISYIFLQDIFQALLQSFLTKQRIECFICQLEKIIMKAFFFILCLIITVAAIGQKHSMLINYKPSLTYFGKQSENFDNYYFASRKGDKTFNSSVNILYSYKLSSTISFTTGLEYSQQGQNVNFNADSAYPSNNRQILKIELNYLRIPLTIDYTVFKMKKSALNIYSGISLGIAIKQNDNYQDIILEDILLPVAEKRYKNKDWAIPVGINYKKEITPKIFTNFGCEYLLGLTDTFSENGASKFGVLSEFDNALQSRLALNIGIGFSLTK